MVVAGNLTLIIGALRVLMFQNNLTAYIVPSGDAHYTEFIAECHERRAYISGFTGSAGTAIVTTDQTIDHAEYALLWTDGRYFLQAEKQLPSFWTLMKDGQPNTPSQSQWLKTTLPPLSRVGVDPTLYTKRQWDNMQQELSSSSITLVGHDQNLVDEVWKEERPPCGSNAVFYHGPEFSGRSSLEKLTNVRKEMEENEATVLIVTELDEVAWLLNLRGSDIPFSATFFAYAIVTDSQLHFFVNQTQLDANTTAVLKEIIEGIQIHDYDAIVNQLKLIISSTTGKVWYTPNTNYALVRVIEQDTTLADSRRIIKLTPISLMKAIKNPTEVAGYKNALLRDSAAICEFLAWLEIEIRKGTEVTELSASEKLHSIRKDQDNFVDDSFHTISAAGENGAIIHYMPTVDTNRKIKPTDMYLLDSGGLYKDGTTDITRTIHLGVPSAHQKDCYTRVLKGHIALAKAIFPNRMVGSRLDSFARQYLWEAGLDYNHGTGHGVGSFLNVHEGPFGIGSGYSSTDPGLRENFFTSNEPGYYEDNAFGIRLENVVRVKNVSLEHNFQNRGYLGFEDVTLVPYDHKLIDFSLLTQDELDYLNDYQQKIRKQVGNYMRDKRMSEEAQQWMMRATVPVSENGPIHDDESSTTSISTDPSTTEPNNSSGDRIRLDIFLFILPGFMFYSLKFP